jgi:hypothetical protein
MLGVDEYPLHGEDHEDDKLEIEDGDDLYEDVVALFGIDVGDGSVLNDAGDGGGVAASTDTYGTSFVGKRTSAVWDDFEEINENDIKIAAICKYM